MRDFFPKKDILITLWANFPVILIFINDFVNRRNPVRDTINDYLLILVVINCTAMIVYYLFMRVRSKREENYLRDLENQSWNERMANKYKNWKSL